MNINTKKTSGLSLYLNTVALLFLLFSSCVKAPVSTNTSTPEAAVNFIQASPDEPAVNLSFNNTKFGVTYLNYGQSTSYLAVNTGVNIASFNNASNSAVILTDTLNFNANAFYSVFLVNKPQHPGVFLLTDTLKQPATGAANIRFINLSPDAPAVDLVIKGGPVLVPNRPYEAFSSFAPLTAGQAYTFEVHTAGTSTVLASITNYNVQLGYTYTFWLYGLAAGTSAADQLSLDVIINAVP